MKRTPIKRRTPLRSRTCPRRTTSMKRGGRLARRTPLARSRLAPASKAQRAKVAGSRCLVCGRATRVDPAHLIPRSLGGCDDPACVVALCRPCHGAYDAGALDLVADLEPGYRLEAAHAVSHVGLVGALRRLSGRRPIPVDEEGEVAR